MKTILLNAAKHDDAEVQKASSRVEALLKAQGYDLRIFNLDAFDICLCVGCFDCWLRSPSLCLITYEGQELVIVDGRETTLISDRRRLFKKISVMLSTRIRR